MDKYHPKIAPFIEYLQSLTTRPILEDVIQQMQAFDISTKELGDFVQFHTDKYCRNLMFENEYAQLICICWKNGQSSSIHDHSSSICAVKIIDGIATETIYETSSSKCIKPLATVDYPTGVIGSKDSDIHHIANLQDNNQDLVTLHCYAPPLEKVQVFSTDTNITQVF